MIITYWIILILLCENDYDVDNDSCDDSHNICDDGDDDGGVDNDYDDGDDNNTMMMMECMMI